METVLEFRQNANKNLRIAEHMLTVTLPLLQDSKLLLGIAENLFLGFSNTLTALVTYERQYKRIPPFHDNFESKHRMFSAKIIPRYGLQKEYAVAMEKIKEIIAKHKNAPMAFTRKDKFVICDNEYHTETITEQKLKYFLDIAKRFNSDVDKITSSHENIFNIRRLLHKKKSGF
jgi:hypothetical protein